MRLWAPVGNNKPSDKKVTNSSCFANPIYPVPNFHGLKLSNFSHFLALYKETIKIQSFFSVHG